MSKFTINVLTIFPGMFPGPLLFSTIGRALKKGIFTINLIDIRNFAKDKHRSVDDRPYGGGAGMLMKPDVIGRAIDYATSFNTPTKLILMSPIGKRLNQDICRQLINFSNITILCGHFEGIDQRIIDFYSFDKISVGDYVLSGGEIASMVLIDSCVRLLPGVLGNSKSLDEESFTVNNEAEYPQYTRPYMWKEITVPDILLSGDHKKIKKWRELQGSFLTKKIKEE